MRITRVGACAIVLSVLFVLAPATTATAQPEPTVTATPNTDLVDGDQITIAGSDLPTDPAFVRFGTQCVASLVGPDLTAGEACDTTVFGTPDFLIEPTYQATVAARRLLDVDGTSYDCAQVECVAAVVTADLPDDPVISIFTTPLSFVPDPTLLVTPSTDLFDGQEVVLEGTGLPPEGIGRVGTQCVASLLTTATFTFDACDGAVFTGVVIDTDPTFTGTMAVARDVTVQGQTHDCGVVQCVAALVTANVDLTIASILTVDLGFAPRPSITATPDTDLIDGDQVTVTGANIPPIGFTTIAGQCVESLIGPDTNWFDACDPGFVGAPDASATFTARRILTVEGSDYDCAEVQCLAAIGIVDVPFSNEPLLDIFTAPLHFALDPLTITVEPKLVGGDDAWVVVTCSRPAEVTIEVEVRQDHPFPATAAGETTLACDDRAGARIALEQTTGTFWWFDATYDITATADDQGTPVTVTASGDTIVLPFWWPWF